MVWDVIWLRTPWMNFGLMTLKSKKHFVFSDKWLWFLWGFSASWYFIVVSWPPLHQTCNYEFGFWASMGNFYLFFFPNTCHAGRKMSYAHHADQSPRYCKQNQGCRTMDKHIFLKCIGVWLVGKSRCFEKVLWIPTDTLSQVFSSWGKEKSEAASVIAVWEGRLWLAGSPFSLYLWRVPWVTMWNGNGGTCLGEGHLNHEAAVVFSCPSSSPVPAQQCQSLSSPSPSSPM